MNEVPDVAKVIGRSDKLNESCGDRLVLLFHFHFSVVSTLAHQNSFILRNQWLISCEVESISLQCSTLLKLECLVHLELWNTSQIIVASHLSVWMKKNCFSLWLHGVKYWTFCGGWEWVDGGGDGFPSLWNSILAWVCALPSVTLAHLVQVYSLRAFIWGSNINYSSGELESSRKEYDISGAFDHFIEFAWKKSFKKI